MVREEPTALQVEAIREIIIHEVAVQGVEVIVDLLLVREVVVVHQLLLQEVVAVHHLLLQEVHQDHHLQEVVVQVDQAEDKI